MRTFFSWGLVNLLFMCVHLLSLIWLSLWGSWHGSAVTDEVSRRGA